MWMVLHGLMESLHGLTVPSVSSSAGGQEGSERDLHRLGPWAELSCEVQQGWVLPLGHNKPMECSRLGQSG